MSEEEAKAELKAMSREQLELVPHDIKLWVCQGKNCNRHTTVRDYGLHPEYYHTRKSLGWQNVSERFWMCARHYSIFKRLRKNFTLDHIYRRIFDENKQKLKTPNS